VTLGDLRLSALTLIKGLLTFAILIWVAIVASRVMEQRIARVAGLTPSVRVLFAQILKIVLVTIAVVAALGAIGIDLTAFAVFTGALGVGIGLGLQKVVSNLFSGILLLLDRSVKPGDVIALGGSYGWINYMGARYVSLITRDGIEHLIPNEQLITERVENWSYSHDLLRLKVPFGISYASDVRKAIELALEAARETGRVLSEPAPICLLVAFGNSSVDFELRLWINDPRNGITNVKSDVLLAVWDKFHEHGIQIPFPQRDLHLKTPEKLQVVTAPDGDEAG
jgi:small-conductance mechanosensitive channel